MNIFQESKVSLLSLPRDELEVSKQTTTVDKHINDNDHASASALASSSSSFLLLQLPLNCSLNDFTNSSDSTTIGNAYFMTSNNDPSQVVSCIVESKGCTYTVHRVETSNALIVVPSIPSTTTTTTDMNSLVRNNASIERDSDVNMNMDHTNSLEQDRPFHKKSKLGNDTTTNTASSSSVSQMQHYPAHLITKKDGCGGSYFLQLRKKRLRLYDIRNILQQSYMYDPYNNMNNSNNDNDNNENMTIVGCTILHLTTKLQVSQSEIKEGLEQIQAFAIPTNDSMQQEQPQQYCLLADYVMQECYDAIISGLFQFDDDDGDGCCCDDYGGIGILGIDPKTFVTKIMNEILHHEEKFLYIESILYHCLQLLLQENPMDTINLSNPFVLDVSKVSKIIFYC
jgi:hypothetical protein